MANRIDDDIRRSRELLQNPYAYLDGEGRYDAVSRDYELSVHDARRTLENPYAYLDEHGAYQGWVSGAPSKKTESFLIDPVSLLGGRKRGAKFNNANLEAIARGLQVEIWKRRRDLWPARKEVGPIEVLDPIMALQSIGYTVSIAESLGQHSGHSEIFEVAGVIENPAARVQISRRFSPEIRNFTAAHELGHAILHAGSGLHRDRALDGAASGNPRDAKEREADLFAAYFLLPEKQVRAAFERAFLTQQFIPDDANAFALRYSNLDALRSECRTLRDLTRVLASATFYNGVSFYSLAEQFRISTEAMAIRLEELNLVQIGAGLDE